MKREKEFKAYLKKNNKPTKYVGYCKNHIEIACGMDMDEIIVSHQKISMVRDNLKKIESSDNCINDYMVALNHYLQFAFERCGAATAALASATSSLKGKVKTIFPSVIHTQKKPIVQYYDNVPVVERDECLRVALENEYSKILQFAKDILGLDEGYIPVYLSKETPYSIFEVKPSFLRKLERKRQQGKELTRLESEIGETGLIRFSVFGCFLDGETPCIEIYYRNLPLGARYINSAINCLAHEYMHFLHFIYARTSFSVSSSFNQELKEALADFFGFLYSIKCGSKYDLETAEVRYNLWKVLTGSGWPYAYALYFMKNKLRRFSPVFTDYKNKGCINKLIEVFNATTNSADAYDKLIKL